MLAFPAGEATAVASGIAGLVGSRLGDFDPPFETNIGRRAWLSLSGGRV